MVRSPCTYARSAEQDAMNSPLVSIEIWLTVVLCCHPRVFVCVKKGMEKLLNLPIDCRFTNQHKVLVYFVPLVIHDMDFTTVCPDRHEFKVDGKAADGILRNDV